MSIQQRKKKIKELRANKKVAHVNSNIAQNISNAHSNIRKNTTNTPDALKNIPRHDYSSKFIINGSDSNIGNDYPHSYEIDNLRKIVYSCITNSYDIPKRPEFISNGWEYILFTDTPNLHVDGWKVIYIENPDNLDSVRLARRVKTIYWDYLPEHDLNIWVDGNIKFMNNLSEFCNYVLDDTHEIWITKHPQRDCIYEEANACKRLNKDSPKIINKQISTYRQKNLPVSYGLVESNVILRKNTDSVKYLMRQWFEEIKIHSRRDQLSFNYVLWNTKSDNLLKTFTKNTRDKYLKWQGGHKK